MQVWNVLHAARWKYRMQKVAKNRQLGTIAQLCRAISLQLRHVSTTGKNLLSSNMSFRCSHNMVNFGPLAAEIDPVVWGIPANVNGSRVLAALLHGTPVVGVSQTLWCWKEGAIYVRQSDHHVGHCPTFYFVYGPADTTTTPSSLAPVKSKMVYLSGPGLPRLSWKKGCRTDVVVVVAKSLLSLLDKHGIHRILTFWITLFICLGYLGTKTNFHTKIPKTATS